MKGRTSLYCSEAQRSYLTDALLLFQGLFGKLLPFCLHGQTHNVFTANGDELLRLDRETKEGDGTKERKVGVFMTRKNG